MNAPSTLPRSQLVRCTEGCLWHVFQINACSVTFPAEEPLPPPVPPSSVDRPSGSRTVEWNSAPATPAANGPSTMDPASMRPGRLRSLDMSPSAVSNNGTAAVPSPSDFSRPAGNRTSSVSSQDSEPSAGAAATTSTAVSLDRPSGGSRSECLSGLTPRARAKEEQSFGNTLVLVAAHDTRGLLCA